MRKTIILVRVLYLLYTTCGAEPSTKILPVLLRKRAKGKAKISILIFPYRAAQLEMTSTVLLSSEQRLWFKNLIPNISSSGDIQNLFIGF